MRYKGCWYAALVAAVILVFAGCIHDDEETSIPPLSAAGGRVDPGLGPGTHALSSGPGYKASPSWSPRGDRIAFTVDGYVVDKPVNAGGVRRWSTKDFVAEEAEWTSESSLAIFGLAPSSVAEAGSPVGRDEASRSVYQARSREGSLDVEEIATGILAMSPGPEGKGLIVVLEIGPYESRLALINDNGMVYRFYMNPIEGRVTGISLSPDGRRVALAARPPRDLAPSELHVLDLQEGAHRRIARLNEELEIIGAPQWTERGICYVAGKEEVSGDGKATPLYDLFLLPAGSGTPGPAPGVGEDFVASSIQVSPSGERLAVIGRLNSNSPTNLYVLDLEAKELEDVTTNEDMEIKTGPDDLAWSPDGESVAIIARGALSEEPIVHAASKGALLEDFYNLYEIPVEGAGGVPR
jgi:Tol biopolymer transport system component